MSDTPKRIWAWVSLVGDARIPENLWSIKSTPFSSLGDRATEYVRKDIADELAEVVGKLLEFVDHPSEAQRPDLWWWHVAKLRDTLAKYKETET